VETNDFNGRLDADRRVEIVGRVAGILEEVGFTPGAVVEQDQTLFVIEDDLYAAAVREAEGALRAALARVSDAVDVDEARIAQEIALIAVKSDITEEIDRLKAHVAAARELLAKGGPVGRKLDFLAQEFNREANTLCAKSQQSELTAIGLELKTVIDRMREQIQNVE